MKAMIYTYHFPKRKAKKRFKDLKNHSNARNVRRSSKYAIKYSKNETDYIEYFCRP